MLAIVGGSVAAVVVIVAVVATVFLSNREHKNTQASATGSSSTSAAPGTSSGTPPLPAFKPAADLGANCQYEPSAEQAGKPVNLPRQGKVPTDPI